MSTAWLNLLSDAALQKRSGAAVFARAQSYAANGAVHLLAEEEAPARDEQLCLVADVQGTEVYRTRAAINLRNQLIGSCDCPHAQDGYFCKHQVALCLIWRGQLGGDAPVSDAEVLRKITAARQRVQAQADKQAALERFVQEQSAEDLAALVWRWAIQDRKRMSELKAWQAEHNAGNDTKALRALIGDLLRPRGDPWAGGNYVEYAERVLAMLQPWVERDPEALRELCEHALRCLYKGIEYFEDEEDELLGQMEAVVDLLTEALHAAPPPAAWVDRWFKLMDEDEYGIWNENAILAACGTAVQERYIERARSDWERWNRERSSTTNTYGVQRARLRERWLISVEMQQEPRALLEAMTASADGPSEFNAIVELCETHNWLREAMQWAQTAAKRYPDFWQTQENLLRCYERDGWDEEALALRRNRLEKNTLSIENYHATLDAAVRAGHERTAYRTQLMEWAAARESGSPRDVSVRLRWLLADNDTKSAMALMQQGNVRCHSDLLETLALALPEPQYGIAVQWLKHELENLMVTAKSPYHKPLELVSEITQRLSHFDATVWLSDLRRIYRRKRHFIEGLPQS